MCRNYPEKQEERRLTADFPTRRSHNQKKKERTKRSLFDHGKRGPADKLKKSYSVFSEYSVVPFTESSQLE
jgi:hypothetical protein